MTGISGRKIWETWSDFAKVMRGPYFKMEKVLGRSFDLRELEQAMEAIRSGESGKMLVYPGGKS